ncbi:uncharacterized protein LAJ45_08858 [Morchella importuna]|uniref:uncharacterized protein n=1 Tax=Morchella importuna TaxID=1174673 RepID=UPI001E8CE88C|nr:uncharacterized protein LAJ45_08858 [Morchella importuna]KAH8147059.1 hypothetical protein LAJ45_08858 [Morchella importuna]
MPALGNDPNHTPSVLSCETKAGTRRYPATAVTESEYIYRGVPVNYTLRWTFANHTAHSPLYADNYREISLLESNPNPLDDTEETWLLPIKNSPTHRRWPRRLDDYNAVARLANSSLAVTVESQLIPLRKSDNQEVEEFAVTQADIDRLNSADLNSLLESYGLPTVGQIAVRRWQLKKYFGITVAGI